MLVSNYYFSFIYIFVQKIIKIRGTCVDISVNHASILTFAQMYKKKPITWHDDKARQTSKKGTRPHTRTAGFRRQPSLSLHKTVHFGMKLVWRSIRQSYSQLDLGTIISNYYTVKVRQLGVGSDGKIFLLVERETDILVWHHIQATNRVRGLIFIVLLKCFW